MRDKRGGRYPLTWKSRSGKRVAGSTIKVEAIGLGEAMEMVVSQRNMEGGNNGEYRQ